MQKQLENQKREELMKDLDAIRKIYPRVSEIISKQNEFDMRQIPVETLLNAQHRGTEIHDYCTKYILNELWTVKIDPEYRPYLESFIQWYMENVEETIFMSQRLYDDVKRFTGEPDMVFRLKGSKRIVLADIKTSYAVSKTWAIQLAAYKHLLKIIGIEVDDCINIHLKKTKSAVMQVIDGVKVVLTPAIVKPILIEQNEYNKSWQIFESALICFDYFDRERFSLKFQEEDHVFI